LSLGVLPCAQAGTAQQRRHRESGVIGQRAIMGALNGKMMSVPVESGNNFFHAGLAKPLFQTQRRPAGYDNMT